MAFVRVYFDGLLKDEVEINKDVTTIGRNLNNDVTIDNSGVSSMHARILKNGDAFVIEDAGSKNGVFIKGQRITRQAINYGDEVTIVKYTLKVSPIKAQTEAPQAMSRDTHQVDHNSTVVVNPAKLKELLKAHEASKETFLQFQSGENSNSTLPLTKTTTVIGKTKDCDIYTPGWFAPSIAAKVVRKSDGFYLAPTRRGKVFVNGVPIHDLKMLKDGDKFDVRGIAINFYHRATKRT